VDIFDSTTQEFLFLYFPTNSFIPDRNEAGNKKVGKG